MSRIGRKHIDVPAGVSVAFENGVVARFALVFAGQNLYVIAFSDIKIVHQSILR